MHTFDSLEYVAMAQRQGWQHQFHPHHLLYHQILYGIAQLKTLSFQTGSDPFFWYVFPAALFGGCAVGAVWGLSRLFFNRFLSLLAALGMGFSYSMIFMATDIEKYPIAVFFLIKTCHLLFRSHGTKSNDINHGQLNFKVMMGVGILHAMAVWIHQASLLFGMIPVVAYFLLMGTLPGLKPGFTECRHAVKPVMMYIVVLGILVMGVYLAAGTIVQNGFSGDILTWSTQYIHEGSWGHGLSDCTGEWVLGSVGSRIGLDLYSAITDGRSWRTEIPEVLFCGGYALAWISIIFGFLIPGKRIGTTGMVCFLIWELSYTAFVIWWEPLNTKVAVLVAPAFWLLLMSAVNRIMARGRRAVPVLIVPVLLIVLLVQINIPRAIRNHNPLCDRDGIAAGKIAEVTQPEDVILVPYNSTIDRFLIHFLNRTHTSTFRTIAGTAADTDEFREIIHATVQAICRQKKTLYVTWLSCAPIGRNPVGNLTNSDIASVMKPILDHTVSVADLGNGDRLLRVDIEKVCALNQK